MPHLSRFTYQSALQHLYSQLPMYQRIGAAAFKKDLTNTLALCEMLGNPHKKFKTVHIAGTNGKGSVSHIIAGMLGGSGYKTGLYISPHYKDFRERIKINGNYISQHAVLEFVRKHQAEYLKIKPSFFEITVAMAFDYFARQKVDVAVIETGLGGRLDSTNVITPVLSVITNIGFDHMQFLGNTLQAIAFEKAGIIKPGVPVVIGESAKQTSSVFIKAARERKAPIYFADKHIQVLLKSKNPLAATKRMTVNIYENKKLAYQNIATDLFGNFQLKNIATAWFAVQQLAKLGFKISESTMKKSLAQIKRSTKLIGRWETKQFRSGTLVVKDSGHNEHGLKQSLPELEELKYRTLQMVIGFVNDKDLSDILPLFPKHARYYFCKPNIPRGLDAEDLRKQAAVYGLMGDSYPSVKKAFAAAHEKAGKNDVIFIGGSTFVVAELS